MINARPIIRAMSFTHSFWYRLTRGLVGGKIGAASVLLLTTTGRKTGKARTTPLLYLKDGENIAIVASNAGDDRPPLWWNNLQAAPSARVQLGRVTKNVTARAANDAEQERLWPLLVKMYPDYETYRTRTTRAIPVVILESA